MRCLADSNRRRRFCRPLTKPLIQGTGNRMTFASVSNAGAKVVSFFETTKFFCYFFVQQHDFYLFSHSFALSFSSFSWHPVHPSHGSSLFRIRSYTHQAAYANDATIAIITRISCIILLVFAYGLSLFFAYGLYGFY